MDLRTWLIKAGDSGPGIPVLPVHADQSLQGPTGRPDSPHTLLMGRENKSLLLCVMCPGGSLTSHCPCFLWLTRPCSVNPKILYNISEIGMHLTTNVMSKLNQQQCFLLKIIVQLLIEGDLDAMKHGGIPFSISDTPW